MGLRHQGKCLPLERGLDRDMSQGGMPMQRKSRLILISMGIREGLDSGTLVGCLSLMFVLLTQTQTPMMGDPHKKNLDQHKRRQKGKYLEVFLER